MTNGSKFNPRDRLRLHFERDISRRSIRLMLKHWLGVVLVPVAVLLAASAPGHAQSAQHAQWVGTWAASPMLAVGGFAVRPFAAVTLREVVHISNGGEQIRVR